MAQRRPRDQRVVRNRRVAIYTFLLILTLFIYRPTGRSRRSGSWRRCGRRRRRKGRGDR